MDAKFLASVFSFLSIFLAIYAQTEVDEVWHINKDNETKQLISYDIRKPLSLVCKTSQPNVQLKWMKNGTDVSEVKELKGRYTIIDAENIFMINKTSENDDGRYSCSADGLLIEFKVVAYVFVRVPSNAPVVQGEQLKIHCNALGTDPELRWTHAGVNITQSTERIKLEADDKNITNAILRIENVDLSDAGEYICYGSSIADTVKNRTAVSDTCTVRVKGKYAALWPFLGICAEVLILCTIILIYEKRRNKSELEESDTDPQEQ